MPKVRRNRRAKAVKRAEEGVKPVIQPENHGANLLKSMHSNNKTLIDDIVADLHLESGNIGHVLAKLECAGEICDELHGKIAILRPSDASLQSEESYRQLKRDFKSITALLDSSINELDECDLGRLKRSANALRLNLHSID